MNMRNNLQKCLSWLGISMICSLIFVLSACSNQPLGSGSAPTIPMASTKGSITASVSAGNMGRGSIVSSTKNVNAVLSGSAVRLTTVRMINRWVGWAVANKTTVLRTVDGGNHWKIVTPLYTNGPSSLVPPIFTFTDGLHGWMAYPAGIYQNPLTILRTTDGGLTWRRTTISTPGVARMEALQFRGNIGWLLVGSDPGAGNEGFYFYKTADAGAHWSYLSKLFMSDQVTGISFLDTTTGFLAFGGPYAAPHLAVTHNGGLTWTTLTLPGIKHLPASAGEYLTTPPVLFGSHGYLPVYVSTAGIQNFVIYQTFNSGQTWSAGDIKTLSPAVSTSSLSDFYIVDQQHGYLTDAQGATWLTAMNGTSWRKLTGKVGPAVNSLSFTDSQHGWAAGNGLWRTTDGGNSWQAVNYIVQ